MGLDQRLGYGAGSGPELDDEALRRRADRGRHRARERSPRWRDRAGQSWRRYECLEKTRAVGEPSSTCLVQRSTLHFGSASDEAPDVFSALLAQFGLYRWLPASRTRASG